MASKKIDYPTEIRFQPDQAIRLSILGGSNRFVTARMLNLAGRRAQLHLDERVRPGDEVRVELSDCALLAEITACSPDASGFLALLKIYHAIPKVSDLGKLMDAIMKQSPRETMPAEMMEREVIRVEAVRTTNISAAS